MNVILYQQIIEVIVKKNIPLLIFFLCILTVAESQTETGYASWYGGKFQGRQTASGEIFDTHELTAAHKTLPFGTLVEVTNLKNGKTVEVRVNDRGPFVKGRIIDLSMAAAQEIGLLGDGVARVEIKVTGENIPVRPGHSPGEPGRIVSAGPVPEYYSIQVASFRQHENARKLGDSLITGGFKPELESSAEGFVRVVIPRLDEAALTSAIDKLSDLGHTSILVRRHFGNDKN